MASPRTARFQRTSSRPNRAWAGLSTASFTAVAGSGGKVLLVSFVTIAGIDETILRNVGTLAVKSDQDVADEVQIGAMGLIRVTDTAFAAGVASVPGPITDIEDDGWMVYVPIVQSFQFVSGVGVSNNQATQYHFDSKAKRIIQKGVRVAVVLESTSNSDGFSVALVMRSFAQIRGTR